MFLYRAFIRTSFMNLSIWNLIVMGGQSLVKESCSSLTSWRCHCRYCCYCCGCCCLLIQQWKIS